ncbi:MAG: hypothetical protein HOW73_36930 [Polyangiaceae bacterium]|nr:hypothetical protein [Polyangiaceae bacterium]
MRPLMMNASEYDAPALLVDWRWRVPPSMTPLFISALGDWVFGAPDGSLWALSMLEGDLFQVAGSADEYNQLNKSAQWLDETFAASWLAIADRHGLVPSNDECLGWHVHPRIGGRFEVANLKLCPMRVYQSLMGQLHQSLG